MMIENRGDTLAPIFLKLCSCCLQDGCPRFLKGVSVSAAPPDLFPAFSPKWRESESEISSRPVRYHSKAKDTLFLRRRSRGFLPAGQMVATSWAEHGPLLLQSPTPGKKEWDATGSVLWWQEQSQDGGQWLGSGRARPRGTLPRRLSCVVFAFELLAGFGYWRAPARQVLLVSSLRHLFHHFST